MKQNGMTQKTSRTSGPFWYFDIVEEDGLPTWYIADGDDVNVACLKIWRGKSNAANRNKTEADARLFAASPALLSALKEMLWMFINPEASPLEVQAKLAEFMQLVAYCDGILEGCQSRRK